MALRGMRGLAASGVVVAGGVAAGILIGRGRRRRERELETGEVLEPHVLGSDARYRVLETDPETVEVEVLDAPGLTPGMHVRLTAVAARAARRLRRQLGNP